MRHLAQSLHAAAALEVGLTSLTALSIGAIVAWSSGELFFPLSIGLLVLGLCWLFVNSSVAWLYGCLASSITIPAIYLSSLGEDTPVYLSNFVFLLGGTIVLAGLRQFHAPLDDFGRASLLFLSALMLSIPFAYWVSGPDELAQSLLRLILIVQPFFVYAWIRNFVNLEGLKQLRRFIDFLLWMGGITAVYGIIDFYFPVPISHPFADQYIFLEAVPIRRAQGILYEASSFGNLCAFFLCLSLGLLVCSRPLSRLRSTLLGLGAVVFTLALFLSYSRGAWVVALIAIPILLRIENRLRFGVIASVVAVFCTCAWIVYRLSASLALNFFFVRLGNLLGIWSDPNTATSGRWESWGTLLSFFADHPWLLLFGIGYKTIASTDLFGVPVVADNGYLSVLFETGVVGLISFLWLNYVLLRSLIQAGPPPSPMHRVCRNILFAFWCGELIQMLTGDIFTYWRNLTTFFALLAAVLGNWQSKKQGMCAE